MNININELNEIAQVITYGLRAFNPDTMLFGEKTSAVFPNFNRYTVMYESTQKKVFGLQSVLECLAKSLGYNTYKGLLESGEQNFQLKKTALIGLNPYPLNIFYTDKWELFSVVLMSKILSGDNFSSNVLKNFKPTKLTQYLSYGNSQIDLFLDYTPFKNITGFEAGHLSIGEYAEEYSTIYSVAKAMQSKAIEELLKKYNCLDWFEGDEYKTDIFSQVEKMAKLEKISMKFEDFLSVKAWDDTNYSKFINRLKLAFSRSYKGKIDFIGEGRSPMDKTVNFVFNQALVESLFTKRIFKKNFDNYKQACILLFDKYATDKALYGNRFIENKSDEFAYNGVHLKREYALITEDEFTNVGTINYWINNSIFEVFKQVFNVDTGTSLFSTFGRDFRLVSVSEFVENIEKYISNNLFLRKNLVKLNLKSPQAASKNTFEYKFKLQTNDEIIETVIPKIVTIQSKFPLKHYLAEIFIQAKLCEIVDISLQDKDVGHPTTFYIDEDKQYKINIVETRSDAIADAVWQFDLFTSIHSLSLLFSETHSEVRNYDEFGLDWLNGVKRTDVNGEQCFYLCKDEGDQISAYISLVFADTPYEFGKAQPLEFDDGRLIILAVLNKKTNDLQLKYVGDDMDCQIIRPEFSLGLENCPHTQAILDYLKGLDVFKELLCKFMTTVHHKTQDGASYVEVVKMNKEIMPNEAVRRGQGLNDLIQDARYNLLDFYYPSENEASENTSIQLEGGSSTKGLLIGHSVETGKEVWLGYKDLTYNAAICGATGSGTTIVNDLLMNQQIRNGGGLLLVDPHSTQKKLDSVYESARLAGRENDVVVINFDNPESSKTYNPFLSGDAWEVSTRIMSIIASDKVQVVNNYYRTVGQQALGTIVAAFQCLGEVYGFEDLASVMLHEDKLKALESRLLERHAEADATVQFQALLSRYSLNQDFEVEAFKLAVGGVASRLADFSTSALGLMMKTNTPEINLRECVLQNKIVYVLLPDIFTSPRTMTLSKLVMADCRSVMASYQSHPVEDSAKPPFIIFASECSGYMDKSWSRMFEYARISRTSMIATFQTPTSLQPAGDTTLSDIVMGNTKTKLFLKQASMESAIKVADEIGMKMNLKGEESYIIPPEKIMSLPIGECFVNVGNSQIERVRLARIGG